MREFTQKLFKLFKFYIIYYVLPDIRVNTRHNTQKSRPRGKLTFNVKYTKMLIFRIFA